MSQELFLNDKYQFPLIYILPENLLLVFNVVFKYIAASGNILQVIVNIRNEAINAYHDVENPVMMFMSYTTPYSCPA